MIEAALTKLEFFFGGMDMPLMDAGNVFCGACFAGKHWIKSLFGKCECHFVDVFVELLRGAAVFPFLIFLLATVNSDLMPFLLTGNRTVLCLAALVGVFAVWNSDKLLWFKKNQGE